MEIGVNSKQLHKHSMPIIVVSLGLFVATLAGISQVYGTHSNVGLTLQSMQHGIVNSNRLTAGVFKLDDRDQTAVKQPPISPTINPNLSNLGQSARLRATVYSEADQN